MQDNPRKRKHSLPSPPSSGPSPRGRTRRRIADEYNPDPAQSPEPLRKRYRGDLERSPREELNCCAQGAEEAEPIQHWVRSGKWPKHIGEMTDPESDGSNKRRRSSTPSYSSRRRNGSAPPAHTAAYEEELQRHGIMFDDLNTKDLTYIRLFQRASKCSEERVRRDLTPHIVPSAELLYVVDRETILANVREEMSGDWTKCSLLGGTQPRPDYAYGLSSATFTEEERAKLENYTNINNPTKFTDFMYFPFLLCEAKCGRRNINDADRQNVHSASIAVNAIIQLCRAAGEDHAQILSGQILVFSISHDNERVKIYGHFPLIRDGRTTFHRYYVHNYSLDGHYGRDRDTGSNFTRAVYRDFYPSHLKRLQQAVARLSDPRTTSVVSDVSVDEGEARASEQSSQERDSSPRPSFRRAKSQGSQGELTLMKQQMAKLEQMHKAQLEQQKEESRKQMEQQREDSQKQMQQQREESQKQMALLERLLNREQGSQKDGARFRESPSSRS
ncbi:hypothetical protein M409DRAFT_71486 [Zasmidium cellare ATCC 36951]|uniref:DUF7924 domain-containing protein n=1 Tax=Zasmidium cellare ATCC 36951 TaxID=1080233 RepID=A0A6A6BXS3_ZASCE|nr:uncharacterized protein M409DRAFT_71486 [Zasmidium cellare ATCC 36951]KAF2158730.1 hypothetical protein M409DRAFT_71486 [Zasmidium cellare ATCC 36951]